MLRARKMGKKRSSGFADLVVERYKEMILTGVIMVALTVWLYEYHYAVTSDDLVGIIAAVLLFFGTLLIGAGIRGWRDGEDYRNRYTTMRTRGGAELTIKKRKKRKW